MLSSRATNSSAAWIYLLPALPTIAWLLNYRCQSDIPEVPVAYAYCVLMERKGAVFVDERKFQDNGMKHVWADMGIEVKPYGVEEVGNYVKGFAETVRIEDEKKQVKVWAPKECSWALANACGPVSDPLPWRIELD